LLPLTTSIVIFSVIVILDPEFKEYHVVIIGISVSSVSTTKSKGIVLLL